MFIYIYFHFVISDNDTKTVRVALSFCRFVANSKKKHPHILEFFTKKYTL